MDRRLPAKAGQRIKYRYPKRGRPAFEANEQQRHLVTLMTSHGASLDLVAQSINNAAFGRSISYSTLVRHFREEIDKGMARAHFLVARAAYCQAVGLQVAIEAGTGREFYLPAKPVPMMTMWWLKTRMGWRSGAETVPLAP